MREQRGLRRLRGRNHTTLLPRSPEGQRNPFKVVTSPGEITVFLHRASVPRCLVIVPRFMSTLATGARRRNTVAVDIQRLGLGPVEPLLYSHSGDHGSDQSALTLTTSGVHRGSDGLPFSPLGKVLRISPVGIFIVLLRCHGTNVMCQSTSRLSLISDCGDNDRDVRFDDECGDTDDDRDEAPGGVTVKTTEL
ncbi:unnamed protein product [Pleuronectes platessa]|uniref:Uncharacterized protein n=1 Tax=Pleuronectes platessa TaxID=8262 RepID=A0A9N7TRY1_PLEPL|nr:unnamed protein product [Pleuronectes platessa]